MVIQYTITKQCDVRLKFYNSARRGLSANFRKLNIYQLHNIARLFKNGNEDATLTNAQTMNLFIGKMNKIVDLKA